MSLPVSPSHGHALPFYVRPGLLLGLSAPTGGPCEALQGPGMENQGSPAARFSSMAFGTFLSRHIAPVPSAALGLPYAPLTPGLAFL